MKLFIVMSILFTSISIRDVKLRNRIVMSPMCQYSSTDGFANDWHLVHLGSRAVGGAGLIITEATAVSPEGRISPGDLGLWKENHIEGLVRIVNFIHQQGSVAGIQLAHAGRKASCAVPWEGGQQLDEEHGGWKTVAPGNVPFHDHDRKPEALKKDGIKKVISDFKDAAERAYRAGFKILEIHAAHGYLIHEFLSPLSNQRTDEYGGSFENRVRLLLQVVEAVRSAWPPENPLFVRISSTDWADGGWTIGDSIKLSMKLKEHGVDLVDCSSGGNVPGARIPFAPGYQVPFSEAVRKTGIMTGAVGFITRAAQAEEIIQKGKADLVIIAKEFLRNPYFPLNSARKLDVDVHWPAQYLRAKVTGLPKT
jgi:2,4-dienoyl-CoA reductase-like NADH-dependent reductase (Old Yellow Enzyme family)